MVAVFSRPCGFCGSNAKQTKDHAGKCASVFQLLAMRHLRAVSQDAPLASRGPALKQGASPPLYCQFQQHDTPLGRAFGLGPARDDSSTTGPSRSLASVGPPVASVFPPPGVRVGSPPRLDGSWLTNLRLHNHSNVCFMNAVFLSLLHAAQGAPWHGRVLRGLFEVAQQAVTASTCLSLTSQLLMRSILPAWVFDGRQHDAAEFAMAFFGGLGLMFGQWQARVIEDGQLVVSLQGIQPLVLAMHGAEPTHELLVRRWHRQQHLHALTDVPGVLLLQLARYADGRKLHTRVIHPRYVRIPVFSEGLSVQWELFRLVAVVEHIGSTLDSGHYRAVLRSDDQWWHTDDFSAAVPARWSRSFEQRSYLLLLAPAQNGRE